MSESVTTEDDTDSENNVASDSASEQDSVSNNGTEQNGTEQIEGTENTTEESGSISVNDTVIMEEVIDDSISENDIRFIDDAENELALPGTVDAYLAKVAEGRTEFYIASLQDFLDAQILCADAQVDGFAGVTLIIQTVAGGVWDITSITADTYGAAWAGIGTEANPFKGTLKCAMSNGNGVQIKINKPLLAYMGDGAKIHQLDINCVNSLSGIAENMTGAVTIDNIWLRGTIGSGSGNVGPIAGNIASDSEISVSNVKVAEGHLTVSGTIAGGIAGVIGNNVTVTLTDTDLGKSDPTVVQGTEAAGGYYGQIVGSHTWDLADANQIDAKVISNAAECYAGQFAGVLWYGETTGKGVLTITGGNSITVDVSGVGYCGGILGVSVDNTSIIHDGTFTIAGTIQGESVASGGVIGLVYHSRMELADYIITATVTGAIAGGIVGQMIGGRCIIKNTDINTVTGTTLTGGLIGDDQYSAVEIQGTFDIATLPSGGTYGLVVGKQYKSLIYLSEVEGVGQILCEYDLGQMPEIGTYGGLFRNQTVGSKKLIGDGTLANIGKLNNRITYSDGWYQLTSAADFEALAITQGSNGEYGCEAFGLAKNDFIDLMTASFKVMNSVDISYLKTGIVTLNRNDQIGGEYHAFAGKMQGVSSSITITQNINVKQKGGGLFNTLKGDVEFSDLIFDGTVQNAYGVGGLAYMYVNGGSLTLNNVKMQKTFTNDAEFVGGLIAKKLNGNAFTLNATNITLASNIYITDGSVHKVSGGIVQLNTADLNMNGVVLGGSMAMASSDNVGGFLGLEWTSIGGTIKNVSVQSGTEYGTYGKFGILWHTITNNASEGKHLTLDKVAYNGLTVNANPSASFCSLIVRDARNLVANIIDYDTTDCVVNNPGSNFDEVAGMTRTDNNRPLPANSGIISLHSRSVGYFPAYHYENKVASLIGKNNAGAMYYYDLFQYVENEDGTVNTANQISGNVLDTPAKVLLWNVVQMCNSKVTDTFKPYFTSGTVTKNASYTFASASGTLDLSGISYYPSPYGNGASASFSGGNTKIKFGAKTDAVDMSSWQLSNVVRGSQHYGLQAGLFNNDNGAVTLEVSELAFTGTIANLGSNRTGVLMAGDVGLTGGQFTDITLDDLWIADYAKETKAGLLISNIPSGTVTFDGIQMINYPQNSATKAGAALIGSAGGEYVTELVLRFTNMVIADDADTNDSAEHNGDVLAYASFLCYYDYTEDTESNKGSGIYLFAEADCPDNVTYGLELDETTEFMDNTNLVLETLGLDNTMYKPYVHTVEKIEVNPKSGDILKGCGTYEDPYIIENDRQFLTLYRYLSETANDPSGYQYKTFYELGDGWKVIKTGTDSDDDFCATKHSVTWNGAEFVGDGEEDAAKFGDADFPTPDQLSHAYYRLEADINLAGIKSETYKIIAGEFIGFGTANRPFTGVWYGKGTDSTIHTVTLPNKDSAQASNNYGFIQYAKGAVVKDMIIKTSKNNEDAIDTSVTAMATTSAGGVIATVLGGDNIIDNVVVGVDIFVAGKNAAMGGYVGVVKKGGLILRKIGTNHLTSFRLNQARSASDYPFLGGIVGKVEDGYVLYEGAGTGGDSYLWDAVGYNTAYPAIPNYTILNADKLKSDASTLCVEAETTFVESEWKTYTDFTFKIPNEAGLQIMSMALNSSSLNVYGSGDNAYGYTKVSRSRKAAYSDIGCNTQVPDYLSAAKFDNRMGYSTDADNAYAYPYLYNYMGITDTQYLTHLTVEEKNNLNYAYSWQNDLHRTTWELAENSSFDMSLFANSFRGIGALYNLTWDGVSTFHGIFDGNGNKITLALTREIWGNDSSMDVTCRAGLFNTLQGSNLYHVEADFREPDATEANLQKCFEIKDFTLAGSIDGASDGARIMAGGVVASLDAANFIFSDIKIDTENPLTIGTVNNKVNHFGGMIGWFSSSGNVLIRNCEYIGTESKPIVFKGSSRAGGLVGSATASAESTLKIENTQIDYLKVSSSEADAGGLIAYATPVKIICEGSEAEADRISVRNSQVLSTKGSGTVAGFIAYANSPIFIKYAICEDTKIGMDYRLCTAGGLVGITNGNLTISETECNRLTIGAYRAMGGIVGEAVTSSCVSTIKDVTVRDLKLAEQWNFDGVEESLGGIVGRTVQTMTIENAQVLGTKTGDTYNFQINGGNHTRSAPQASGGIVGYYLSETNTLTLKDCTVDTVQIAAGITAFQEHYVCAGGIIGFVGGKVALDATGDIIAQNLKITVPLASQMTTTKVMAAGGCFGYVWYRDQVVYGKITNGGTSVYSAYYDGLFASGNTVTGKYAGGLVGYDEGGELRLSGVTVKNGTVTADEIAGGLVGYLLPSYTGVAFNPFEDVTDTLINQVSDMVITGRIAGGVFGYLKTQGAMRAENVLVSGNTIVASGSTSGERIAGGFIGGAEQSSGEYYRYYDVTLTQNTIVAEVADTTLSNTEIDNLAVGGVVGKTISSATSKKGSLRFDRLVVENTNVIGVRKTGTTTVCLVKTDGETYELAETIEKPTVSTEIAYDYQALEQLETEYGCYIGAMVGISESTNLPVYMMRDDERTIGKFVSPVMANNPPVVDVGRTSVQTIDDYRQRCHIIYGASVADAAVVKTNLTDMRAEVDKVKSDYTATETYEELLQELRLSEDAIELFDATYVANYAFPETDLAFDFPMLVYRVQNGTLQEVMECVTDVMTNVAGASSSDMSILSIACAPKLHDGTTPAGEAEASITATVTNGEATYTLNPLKQYDGLTDDNKLSYTEITYTYDYGNDQSGTHKKIFKIGVFVEEPIMYTVHSMIMEGRVSDVATIKAKGVAESASNDRVIMANDSDYTLLLEYTYGQAREQMADGVAVDKMFYLEQVGKTKTFPVGTQLLLIDVSGGNKPYYYTVEQDNITQLKFSDFRDRKGNKYVNQSIHDLPDETDEGADYYTDIMGHQLTEVGVERFLLSVLSNDTNSEPQTYSIHAGMYIEDENLAARFYLEQEHEEETDWEILAIPALTVRLRGKGSETQTSGEISRTEGLTINIAFEFVADDWYWSEKKAAGGNIIDSSNNGKYIELAFYLRDMKEKRVALPVGTNLSYRLEGGDYSTNKVIPDEAMVYYYKDIRNGFEIPEFYHLIQGLEENVSYSVEFKLDFTGADLSNITDDSYMAWIELLRTANKDYPMGSGNKIDEHSNNVKADAKQKMGFVLTADDLNDLGINTYPEANETDEIPAHIMFDFSEILRVAGITGATEQVLEKWAGFDYEVTYQVYKKVENGENVRYKPYKGTDIVVTATEGVISSEAGNGSLKATYNFTKDEIRNGNGETEAVLSFPCLITQNTAALTTDLSHLTNYKVKATLIIKEKGATSEDAETTEDFFIYTVTKLKTDL